ncbi:MAG: transposon-encoded TnpW family protein [Sporomusa sp.]
MSKNLSAEKSFSAIAANMAANPEATAPPNQPVYMLKRIGSTTYKVAVHFSSDTKETASDKIARLIRNDTEGKVVNQ